MIIISQGDTNFFGAGSADGDIFSAGVVGGGDSEAASGFVAIIASDFNWSDYQDTSLYRLD